MEYSMLKNCPECGALFTFLAKDLCDECSKKDEEEYNKVFKFLRQNPCSSILDVSECTGVSRKKIMEFIHDGRISLVTIAVSEEKKLYCRMCNKEIKGGKLCNECADNFREKLKETKKTIPVQEKEVLTGRMYTEDRRERRRET